MPSNPAATIEAVFGSPPVECHDLSGGQVGTVTRVALADGRTIVTKTGETALDREGAMLTSFAERTQFPVPAVYYAGLDLLLIEYIEGNTAHSRSVAKDAADRLAALHDVSGPAFGFEYETVLGPIPQPNPWVDSWADFYGEHRLGHVLSAGDFSTDVHNRIDAVCRDLADLVIEPAQPTLIHGDLWTTNVVSDDERVRAFLDPAIYYAHPEIELAYIDWTGTFGDAFFDHYGEHRAITAGFWDHRRFVYRLYPLLVHVHLFGGRYCRDLSRTLSRLGY